MEAESMFTPEFQARIEAKGQPDNPEFSLYLAIGNDAMGTNEDVARALRQVAEKLETDPDDQSGGGGRGVAPGNRPGHQSGYAVRGNDRGSGGA
jgi:hypothetical protein